MLLEAIIDTYGYLAVLVGTFLEGETILVLGGLAAQRGYLALPGVIGAAFVGTLCGDQLFFYLGRRHSQRLLAKRPAWRKQVDRADKLLRRFRTPLILGFRFLYGLRTVTPFAIGMSAVPAKKFIPLNILGALVWAVVIGVGGYLFGSALETFIGNFKRYEVEALAVVAAGGAVVWVVYLLRRRRRRPV